MSQIRDCPECGANLYFANNFGRVRDENQRLRRELEREAAAHAITKAKHVIAEIERQEHSRWLQDKVNRQRIALRALQEVATRPAPREAPPVA
jgi:hypothetical protein